MSIKDEMLGVNRNKPEIEIIKRLCDLVAYLSSYTKHNPDDFYEYQQAVKYLEKIESGKQNPVGCYSRTKNSILY